MKQNPISLPIMILIKMAEESCLIGVPTKTIAKFEEKWILSAVGPGTR